MLVLLLKGLCWWYAMLPLRWARASGVFTGWILWCTLAAKRRMAEDALGQSFPEWPPGKVCETTRAMFVNQGIFGVEVLRRLGRPRRDPLGDIACDPEDLARFEAIMRTHGRAMFLTGHVNNYEYLAAWAARLYPMTIIAKPIKPKALGEFVKKMRRDAGVQELSNHASYREALRAVRGGRCLGFIMDQNMTRKRGVFVTFFGRPACTTHGLALLSAQSGAPVVPVFLLRENLGFRVKMYPAIPPPPDTRPETIQDYTQLYSNALEDVIRTQPTSWIWLHRRWRTQPHPGDRVTRPDGTSYHV